MPLSPSLENDPPLVGKIIPAARKGTAQRIVTVLAGTLNRNSFASVIDQAAVSGTGFVTCVIIGRMCSREDLGLYALALSIVRFISGVQLELVCSPYVVYSIQRQGPALAAYTGSTLVHQLLLTGASVLILLALAGLLTLGVGPTGLAPVVWALVGALPFLVLRDYIRQLSLCHLRLAVVLAIDGSVAVLQLGGLLLLGYWHILTVGGAYGIAGTACGLACVGWLLAGRQPLSVVPAEVASDWKQNWSFSRWSLAGFLIGTTTPYFMPWILALAHGEAATGVLAACSTLVNSVSTYVTGMTNVLTPQAVRAFAQDGAPGLRLVLRNIVILFAVTVGTFSLFILATGDLSVRLLYGDKYAGCGAVLGLLSLNALANSLSVTVGTGLCALGRPSANFLADVSALMLTWTVLLWVIGPLGVVGAALALFAGAFGGAVVRSGILLRLLAKQRGPSVEEYA